MSRQPRRGEVWLVDFGHPIGRERGHRRPAVVISSDRLNASRAGLAIVVPITTRHRLLPSHIELEPGDSGLPETGYAKVEDVTSISTERLVHVLGKAPAHVLDRIEHTVTILLDLR
jgi:mRNA interferase MazF